MYNFKLRNEVFATPLQLELFRKWSLGLKVYDQRTNLPVTASELAKTASAVTCTTTNCGAISQ
jgi:hypothetical protein